MRAWADVAELANTKTLNGGLVARCAPGLPFLLQEGGEVAFVPPVLDAPRRARVTSVRPLSPDEAVVSFEGVDDIETESRLVGCHCLVRRSDLPQGALTPVGAAAWEGFQVFDAQAGPVGRVAGVSELPGQRLLEVTRTDAQGACAEDGAPVLVPLVDAIVVRVDEDARRIDVDLPAGLLDL